MTCDQDPAANRERIRSWVEQIVRDQPEVELIMFGEMILGWYRPAQDPLRHRQISESLEGESVRALSLLARRHGIYLCFGISERASGRLYNTQVLLDPEGEIRAIHRKHNLKPGEKSANYQPGDSLVTITEINRLRTAIVICADLANPATIWRLMRANVDLILFSLADDQDPDWFMARLNARLYDAWIVSANRLGNEGDWCWNGHIVVTDPLGRLRAISRDQESYLYYEVARPARGPWYIQALRKTWVRTPLIYHLASNWDKLKAYF